jgi:hypothetical protein
MEVQLNLSVEEKMYLKNLKKGYNELVVPIGVWKEYIENNARLAEEDFPFHLTLSEYVITERDWFLYIIRSFNLYVEEKRLITDEGGIHVIVKVEPKRIMPVQPAYDMFDIGRRQPGSFRSNG